MGWNESERPLLGTGLGCAGAAALRQAVLLHLELQCVLGGEVGVRHFNTRVALAMLFSTLSASACRLRGVLYELSFRYQRFQDFFLAGYFRDNPADIEEICKGGALARLHKGAIFTRRDFATRSSFSHLDNRLSHALIAPPRPSRLSSSKTTFPKARISTLCRRNFARCVKSP